MTRTDGRGVAQVLTLGMATPSATDLNARPGTDVWAVCTTLAFEPTPAQREAVKSWAGLTGLLILGALLVLLAALVVMQRYRRSVLQRKKRQVDARARADAWVEAARRIGPDEEPRDGSRDETVDIDPDEIGPSDVDGPEDDDPDERPRGGRR